MIDPTQPVHASAFSYHGAGILLVGPSGSGKSSITAEAILLGAKLVADDRVQLQPMMGMLAASPVPELANVLELRGIGLVRMSDVLAKSVIHLIVELDPAVDTRLPELEKRELLGISVPYLRLAAAPKTTATALLIYLKAMQENRVLPTDWRPTAK